ncbi:hypothetical protein BH10PSE4_BH10PSE4_24840 [soil metagenome]
MRLAAAFVVAGALLGGCAALPSPGACPAGHSAGREVQLFFGRNIGDRVGVSEADFSRFVDQELTPRFPDGLTVLDAAGQWRGASGVIGREPSKVVILVLAGGAGDDEKLAAVRAAYKARFSQEAVLMTTRPTCLGF